MIRVTPGKRRQLWGLCGDIKTQLTDLEVMVTQVSNVLLLFRKMYLCTVPDHIWILEHKITLMDQEREISFVCLITRPDNRKVYK